MKDYDTCDKCGKDFAAGANTVCPHCGYDWYDPYGNDKFNQKIRGAGLRLVRGFDVNAYYDVGVIRKDDLVDGAYYGGTCRNASVAQWDAKGNCFWYMRNKFRSTFKESINHLADDDGYDLFVPFHRIDDKDVRDIDKVK
jgi:hypothetical protein